MADARVISENGHAVLRRAVVASRGAVNRHTCRLIRSLPLRPMDIVALNVNGRRGMPGQAGAHRCSSTSDDSWSVRDSSTCGDASRECTLDEREIETIDKAGDFVRTLVDMAKSDDVAITVLLDESTSPGCRHQLVKDVAAVVRRTRKPVLVVTEEGTPEPNGAVLVAMSAGAKPPELTERRVTDIADLSGVETVVLSVVRPFRPLFSKVAVGMHACQQAALREIHCSQTDDATSDAMGLCEILRASGVRSWAVGKVGDLACEIRNAAESCSCGLVCLPVQRSCGERGIRALVAEVLECSRIPMLVLPLGD